MTEKETYRKYARQTRTTDLRPYVEGEDLSNVSVAEFDKTNNKSPKVGDMIARNSADPDDKWLVSAEYFAENFVTTPVD